MRPEQRLTLLARGQVARVSKEGITRWQHTSKEARDAYLKEHPNSAYKDIRVNTMGERVSKDTNNKEVGETAKQNLIDMGFKKKTNLRDTAAHLADYLHTKREHRETFAKKGIGVALNVIRKFKPEDRRELKEEAEALTRDPRKKPSTILNTGNRKALIAGVVGIGVCAALFGTGLLDPNIVAFVGIKALDLGASTLSRSLDASSLDEFLIASIIGSFVTSRHGQEYSEGIMGRMQRAYGELMGRPKEEDNEDESETDDDINPAAGKANTNDNNPDDSSDTDDADTDDDSDGTDGNTEKEDMAEPEDITIQRPTAQKLKAISDAFEQAGVSVSVEKRPTKPGELQQSVQITLDDDAKGGAAFKRIAGKLGLVHTKTLKPIRSQDINGDSVTGYLTQ